MLSLIFAQHASLASWSIADIAIAVIVIAAIVAIVFIALRQYGVSIPPWIVQVFWVLIAAFVCIFAIRLLMTM